MRVNSRGGRPSKYLLPKSAALGLTTLLFGGASPAFCVSISSMMSSAAKSAVSCTSASRSMPGISMSLRGNQRSGGLDGVAILRHRCGNCGSSTAWRLTKVT